MDLELTSDQRELRAVAQQALDAHSPLSLARSHLEHAASAAALHDLLIELGWFAVGVEDDGFGVPGLILLAQATGAHAAPTALIDTAVAARLAASAKGELAESIAAGETATALAVLETGADWSLQGMTAALCESADGLSVNGEKLGVQHGRSVSAYAVLAEDAAGEVAVAFVAADAPGVTTEAAESVDPAVATATVTFADALVAAALTGEGAAVAVNRAFAIGGVAATAEGLGAASAALDLAIEYSLERRQFGRPIGTFQALQHVMADAHVDREAAWSAALYAAAALDEELPEAMEAARIAKAYGARASRSVVEAALQVLGGIAFTWEHDVHLLQRRVLSSERRFGDAITHEGWLGDALAARAMAVPA